ncbi:winged helix-turn-helix domain-containing protein [Dehalobacter restrictus]|uniref:Winged helix family transcriptional regulator n=1 Tax=Dehalobacter restrictus TaxID=55583 RepID=A0A857DL40_9FIRM|nr:winged helix-turn-helix domain-containing protein [Dehalobacter restrictus]QHA01677.1 winged helix family transcriptional regulator [Dehalobacter restrictus]
MEKNLYIRLGDNIFLDTKMEQLVKDNICIPLSQLQYRLLYYLVEHMGTVVQKKELIKFAWGTDCVSSNDLYVNINSLRKRIEDHPKNPQYIITYKSVGYAFFPRKRQHDNLVIEQSK